jgi:hypothetical protein
LQLQVVLGFKLTGEEASDLKRVISKAGETISCTETVKKEQLYTSLDKAKAKLENALHHPTEEGGKNIKVFTLFLPQTEQYLT